MRITTLAGLLALFCSNSLVGQVGGVAALYVGNWTDLGAGALILVPEVQIVASALIERASQREER